MCARVTGCSTVVQDLVIRRVFSVRPEMFVVSEKRSQTNSSASELAVQASNPGERIQI